IDEQGIRGKNRVVFLSNLLREVQSSPSRRTEIIHHFVDSLAKFADTQMGEETWLDACTSLFPVLKPRDYVDSKSATRNVLSTEWVGDVIICYILRNKNILRFVTAWDLGRWEKDAQALHQAAIENLVRASWPRHLLGGRQEDGGRLIMIA